jgi:5-(carboxyamino)imidazole ribonucleotide synthase
MTIGILGGGQLGRMLILAGAPLGLDFKVFDPSSEAVAGRLAPLLCDDINDVPALGWFAKNLDFVTYEWENVPVGSAKYLSERVPVFPPVRALEISSDRLKEKSFFRENGVPTPDFVAIETREELGLAVKELGLPCVLKTRKFGYDGKGQMVLKTPRDVERGWSELGGAALILEKFVAFDRELSILAVRGKDGEKKFYPLVENHHEGGILRLSIAPAPNWSAEIQSDAEKFASKILDKLGYVGVLALELFQVGERLLANEIAPRVHNSGHWTIEGSHCSQFENHLRAVAGLPLGSTEMKTPHAAMVNLIGGLPPLCDSLKIAGAHAHFYGKQPKPGRKVGHITLVASSAPELQSSIAKAQELAAKAHG